MIEFDKLDDFFAKKIIIDDRFENAYYDLHLHTKASDGFLNIKFLKSFLQEKNHLISITDHNDIRKSIEIFEEKDINTIPGIEIGCEDGMEILAYFHNPQELEKFYRIYLEPYRNKVRMAKTYKSWDYYLEVLKQFDTHTSIPHINGYVQKNFIKNKDYIEKIIREVDSIETYNHALSIKRNLKAQEIRKKYDLTATFGSDAHTKFDVKSYARLENNEISEELKILEGAKKIYSIVGLGGKHLKYIFKK
ncbi:MAG: PHP domain-containing protein [Psychrilyobacter sp.]|nr:PHP domain-containing protein [Psychrilyobacter sp.]